MLSQRHLNLINILKTFKLKKISSPKHLIKANASLSKTVLVENFEYLWNKELFL